jgi:hypothetical protein
VPAQAESAAAAGGRHQRARRLARRRADGGRLGEYEGRLLDAHLGACRACGEWAAELPAAATVVPGHEAPAPATVVDVEAAGTASKGGESTHIGSETDAMGHEKRRAVVGQGYGPSRGRQLLYYGLFIAFLIAVYLGGKLAIDELDKAPKHNPAAAPWAKPGQQQQQRQPEQFQ